MAFQSGIVRLRGKIGDIVNYRRKGKYLSKKAAESHKQTENTKKSGIDFGKASSAGALIRKAFTPLLKNLADDELYNRLNGKRINGQPICSTFIKTFYHAIPFRLLVADSARPFYF